MFLILLVKALMQEKEIDRTTNCVIYDSGDHISIKNIHDIHLFLYI